MIGALRPGSLGSRRGGRGVACAERLPAPRLSRMPASGRTEITRHPWRGRACRLDESAAGGTLAQGANPRQCNLCRARFGKEAAFRHVGLPGVSCRSGGPGSSWADRQELGPARDSSSSRMARSATCMRQPMHVISQKISPRLRTVLHSRDAARVSTPRFHGMQRFRAAQAVAGQPRVGHRTEHVAGNMA